MTLILNTITPEGIVIASDSRQSFRNLQNINKIGSDNATKIFQINNKISVAISGIAFLVEDEIMKSISKFIEEFKNETKTEKLEVKDVKNKLCEIFEQKYEYKNYLNNLKKQITFNMQMQNLELREITEHNNTIKFKYRNRQGVTIEESANIDSINIMVAGYNKNGSHEAYSCYIPGEVTKIRDSKEKGKEYGASWMGQIDVVSRIVLGYDGRIGGLDFITQNNINPKEARKQLSGLEYNIQWGTMTLQDAIDFCILMIKTTSAIQKFSDGVRKNPGDIHGVGGPIDVAVITPSKGFVWINKKKITIDDTKIDLDKEPNIEDAIKNNKASKK